MWPPLIDFVLKMPIIEGTLLSSEGGVMEDKINQEDLIFL